MKNFRKNCKGTAEVIGTIMFIMILLFFFTNVYLWHDAATKDANQLNLQKINSSFSIVQVGHNIVLTANGGSNVDLSRLWIVDSNGDHYFADLENAPVAAGTNFTIIFTSGTTQTVADTNQITDSQPAGGSISVNYSPQLQSPITCTVINALGIEKSTTYTVG